MPPHLNDHAAQPRRVLPFRSNPPLAPLTKPVAPPTTPSNKTLSHTALDSPLPQQADVSVTSVSRWKSRLGWGTAAVSTAGFIAVAADVTSAWDGSLHLLQQMDMFGHNLSLSIDPSTRIWLWDKCVSDLFITSGLAMWSAMTLHAAVNARQGAIQPVVVVGVAWLWYYLLAGQEGFIVDGLKDFFQRDRPSPIHRTLSFPSGHTTDVTFLWATLLFVLIPAVLHKAPPALGSGGKLFQDVLQRLKGSWPVLGAAWATTAVGRVLSDSHWFSDTLAAGFLSVAITSVLAKLCEPVMNQGVDEGGTEGRPAGSAGADWERLKGEETKSTHSGR